MLHFCVPMCSFSDAYAGVLKFAVLVSQPEISAMIENGRASSPGSSSRINGSGTGTAVG